MYPQTLLPSKEALRRPFATIVLNDDTHSFDEVIEAFQSVRIGQRQLIRGGSAHLVFFFRRLMISFLPVQAVPDCPEEDAAEFAQRIDALGETVVFMGTKEECDKCAAEIGKIGIGTRVEEGWTLCFDLTVRLGSLYCIYFHR